MSDAAATSTVDASATVTSVAVRAQCKVIYEFDTSATNKDLAIPYVIIINGKVQTPDKPRRLSRENRKIIVTVDAGSKVALYLNSDVHPNHRCNPVYAVTADDHDISVKITEQKGSDEFVQPIVKLEAIRRGDKPGDAAMKFYTAKLTGDIWMTISHRYTAVEADSLLSSNTDPIIRKAVRSIYQGLGVPKLDIPLDQGGRVLHVSFIKQDNPHANIKTCSLLNDVLPRTHPHAFAALLSVARKLQLYHVHVTSCWRPSLGSIAHRAGLGLDVNLIADATRKVKINRAGLREKGPSNNPNVTDREKELLELADKKEEAAKKNKADPVAKKEAGDAKAGWTDEVGKSEPKLMHELRNSLEMDSAVLQILDPWYMEFNTAQPNARRANEQKTKDEKIHNHHLHITIKEPKIYE